jgi:hypothetical protein
MKVLKGPTDDARLDSIVTALHYHVIVPEYGGLPVLISILSQCWDYLNRTSYLTDDNRFGSGLSHTLIISLMADIELRLPLELIKAHPNASLFPGISSDEPIEELALQFTLHTDSLVSTGLWLNAGCIGVIEYSTSIGDLFFQVGSHRKSLLQEEQPWGRWPIVTAEFPACEGQNGVASHFGGIVYLYRPPSSHDATLKAVFKGFSQIRRIVRGRPEIFEATQGFSAPWGEVISDSFVLTVPSSAFELPQLADALDRLELAIKRVADFMQYTLTRPFQIIFDVDVSASDFSLDHPIRVAIDDMNSIFTKVGQPYFRLLTLVAMACIRDGYFDEMTDLAMSIVGAYVVVLQTNKGAPSMTELLGGTLPPLVTEIWAVHTRMNDKVLPGILEESRRPHADSYGVGPDRWLAFVTNFSGIAHANFAEMFDAVLPVSENIAKSLDFLPKAPELVPHSSRT